MSFLNPESVLPVLCKLAHTLHWTVPPILCREILARDLLPNRKPSSRIGGGNFQALNFNRPPSTFKTPTPAQDSEYFFYITSSIPQADSRKIFRAQQYSIRGSALKLQDWALYDVVASPVLIDFHLKLAPNLVRGSSIFNFEWNFGLGYLRSTFSQSL